MRVPHHRTKETKGSQLWIQRIINECPEKLGDQIRRKIKALFPRDINWVSPKQGDEFAEYRDAAFLERINHQELSEELQKFWPQKGPRWDAFGISNNGAIILIEAKANVPELVSFCGAKDKD